MNHLGFHFSATECNGWPKLKFFIDDDLYHDFEFVAKSAVIEIPLDLLQGSHEIKIEFYGKTQNNTLISGHNIVKDQLAILETITVDNVVVPDFIKYQGVYHVDTAKHPQILTWGQNGNWILNFEYPIINWILELKFKKTSMQVADHNWANSTFHLKKIQAVRDELKILEKILSDVNE